MRFQRMLATGVSLLCVGLIAVVCSCAPMPQASETAPQASERLYCSLAFAVDPAESPWEATARAVYRQARDICNEHGATISSSFMTNCHDSLEGHVVHVRVWVATNKGAQLADALLKHIRCAEEAVFLERIYISWRHDDSWENGGSIYACFVRGSKEPQVNRRVNETVPLDD